MLDFNSNVHQTYLLVGTLYESNRGAIPHRNLISPRKWKDHLTKEEITTINEAWSRFTYAESLLNENMLSGSRIERWENFLMVEDDNSGEGPKKTGIWGKIKSGIGKGLKWISRKVAGKRSLEKGGSLFGLGAKSRAQRAEWAKLEQDQKELIDILKAATSKDYPNNEDVEEFKSETAKSLNDAEAFIKTHEDPGVRAEMYKALKKWVTYLLDQKIGDHYKHFMENMSLAGALLLLEAEEEALGTKKGSSESIKGLESTLLPTILKILGGAGLAVTAGILAAYPEILNPTSVKAITTEDTSTIQKAIDAKLPPVVVKERFLNDIVPEYFNGLKAQGVELAGDPGNNPKDLVLFFKEIGSGDEAKGAAAFFKKVNIANPGGSANSNYFLERLMGGKSIDDAAFMPGARDLESSFDYEYGTVGANLGAAKGSFMERMGGAAGVPVSISGIIAKQLVNKAIKSVVTKMVAGGVLGAAGAATAAAVAGAVGVGGLLSGFAISRLREKSKKDSRAAFLNDLYDQIDQFEKKEEEAVPPPEPVPPEPPPEEDDGEKKGKEGDIEKKSGKPIKKMTTVNASGSYLSGVANKFLDSIGIKGQDKKYASQPAVAALDTLMKKKALLADSRIRLQNLLETAADIDVTINRVEKDSYKGNPKDHPLFNDVVASIKSQEKLLPPGTTPEKFAEDFMQYLINNDNVALPDVAEEKKIDTKKIVDAASKFVKDDKKAQAEIPRMIDGLKQAGKLNDSLSSNYGKDVSGMNLVDFTKGKSWAPKSISQRAAAVALFKAGAINESTLRTLLREISENFDSKLIAENNRLMKLAGLIK